MSCNIPFPTNELEIHFNEGYKFMISAEAANQDNVGHDTNSTIIPDCVGLVQFDAKKEANVNVGLICSNPECSKSNVITEIGEILAVDTSRCKTCTFRVNTTKSNRIRLGHRVIRFMVAF